MKKPISEWKLKRIKKLHAEGIRPSDIAKKVFVSPATVTRYIRKPILKDGKYPDRYNLTKLPIYLRERYKKEGIKIKHITLGEKKK